jgi:hypothetical protein
VECGVPVQVLIVAEGTGRPVLQACVFPMRHRSIMP